MAKIDFLIIDKERNYPIKERICSFQEEKGLLLLSLNIFFILNLL